MRGQVCVLWEAVDQVVAAADARCLSRLFPCVGSHVRPLSILGCHSVLLNAYNTWVGAGKVLFSYQGYSAETFKDDVVKANPSAFGILPPFAVVDLVVRLGGALQEPRPLSLPRLLSAVVANKVLFAELTGVLSEMIRAWPDIRTFLRLN